MNIKGAFAQENDTAGLMKFVIEANQAQDSLVRALKLGHFEACLKMFSYVEKEMGKEKVFAEMDSLKKYLNLCSKQEYNSSIGLGVNGVGVHGKDSKGAFDIKSSYSLQDSLGKTIFWFNLFYVNSFPPFILSGYESRNNQNAFYTKLYEKIENLEIKK
ncbi:MAG: hypothetical protein EXR21_03245 [Flavobacteriaceae bacterium]|nr:hypothetical protein [Flavobacteriaceae bacterium]